MKFYKTLAIPSILYGSEICVLATKDETNIHSSEMRFLRAVAGYRLIDQKRNVSIRHELQIDSLNQQVQQYRSQWSEHIERMPDERLPKKIPGQRETKPGKTEEEVERPVLKFEDATASRA